MSSRYIVLPTPYGATSFWSIFDKTTQQRVGLTYFTPNGAVDKASRLNNDGDRIEPLHREAAPQLRVE